MSNDACRVTLAGIQVHYCDEEGRRKAVWVDLTKVQAIAWTTGGVGEKKPDIPTGNCDPVPRVSAPDPCDPKGMAGEDDDPFCWWDGSRWVCGEV